MEIKNNILLKVEMSDIQDNSLIIPFGIIEIADNALEGSNVISLELPESLIKIGNKAFYNCQNLKQVILPNSITEIGVSAFEKCTALENVKLSENLIKIPENLFAFCKNLKQVEIPKTIDIIGNKSFLDCESLESIDGKLHKIGSYAFSDCRELKNIDLTNVDDIKTGTFENCRNLQDLKLSDNLKKIGMNAFKNCQSLLMFKCPSNLKIIGMNAFWGCESLKKIEFNNKVEEIFDFAFGDTKIDEVKLPESLKIVGKYPFHMCYNLKSLIISRIYNNELVDETNTKLKEITINNVKVAIIRQVKRMGIYNNLDIIRYKDDSFQIVNQNITTYDKTYFELTFPQYKTSLNKLIHNDEIYNIFFWESILGNSTLQLINPGAIVALSPNINTIKAFNYKKNFYDEFIRKHNIGEANLMIATIKFLTVFNGLCRKNEINVESIFNRIGMPNIVKQFRYVNVCEFNREFIGIYGDLLDKYSIKEINNIMPYLYNNINKVINLKDNITIDLLETMQLEYQQECKKNTLKYCKSDQKTPNYEWLDITNPTNLLWGFILASVAEKSITSSDSDRTVRLYLIKDENGLVVANARAYFSEDEKYLLFNSIVLSQSFVTIGYTIEKVKKAIIDYVLASIEETINFLNEEEVLVAKVHVAISENSIREQLLNRGTKVIAENI